MRNNVLALLLACMTISAHAVEKIKLGQESRSAAGVEKVIAVAADGADTYWISTFIRDGNCPENTGKCSHDIVQIRGPGGVVSIALEDATGTGAFFSQTKSQVALVVLPVSRGGYGYASAEAFVFAADKKPVSVLKTAEVLLNNLEGAACEGRKLCADSKLSAVFPANPVTEYPDIQLRQVGTAINPAGSGVEKVEKTFSFNYDSKTKHYSSKR